MQLLPRILFALAGLAVLAAACGNDADSAPASGDGPMINTLVSAEGLWFLTSGSHEGTELDIRFGEMTMEFPGDGHVVGQAGCNTYRASIEVADDGRWLAGDYAVTDMACDARGLMAAETAFLRALAEATTIRSPDSEAAETFVLTGETTELRFELMRDPGDNAG